MELKSLIADNKSIELEYPDMPGFKLTVNYISKDELRKITQKAKTIGFDKRTHSPTETVDNDLFIKIYVSKALTGWSGLTVDYLRRLIVVNDNVPEDGFVPFSEDNAFALVQGSPDFDGWLSSVMSDIEVFNRGS